MPGSLPHYHMTFWHLFEEIASLCGKKIKFDSIFTGMVEVLNQWNMQAASLQSRQCGIVRRWMPKNV